MTADMRKKLSISLFTGLAIGTATLLALPESAWSQAVTLDLNNEILGSGSGRILQMLALLTILSLSPAILMMVTSFTRIIVVLSFIRTAMGIQQAPPNTVLISLALFLTLFIMTPTMEKVYNDAVKPLLEEEIDEIQAWERGVIPVRNFMLQHVREKDLGLFMDLANVGEVATPEATPLRALIPAFMISELRRAFEIGFLIFLPFLIIDMVVASVLMSMGMMMLPPIMISLPFKLIFFVMVDGWYMIAGSLVRSFG
ncbi:flagellar type III secretion system pore protein FliP [Kiloniella laminariae]|uniref:flagellar type III secretion system pore protein FliP n=1 Tax=Kiloniella laminariae TaxID=454162 RepID=UPI0003806AEB|nr:flagellar type III secretion system pore protein FliP [Kiloniella laminariae]